jgi:tRNA dimethylallyltransferase
MTADTGWPADGVVVIAGPTAAGKTPLAVRLAEECNAEIISADSRQIYRSLNLGTGKPSPEELARVPQHLISRVPLSQTVTAADFAALAESVRREITARGRRCLLVGGTGLWIRAFIDGLAPTPPPDPDLRAHLQARAKTEGRERLYLELQAADPVTAARLHPSDLVRVIRALEIYRLSGIRPSEIKNKAGRELPSVWLGLQLPRADLYARAEARIEAWLRAGWLEEVRALLDSGLAWDVPALQALGYSHLARHLRGEWPLARAVDLIKRDTRRYIKRQLTWFRAEPRLHWLDASAGEAAALSAARAALQAAGWI